MALPHLIGIAGPSCSGKGELSGWLKRQLPGAVILDLDSYYRDQRHLSFEQRCRMNYDLPAALDTALLFEQVAALARNEAVEKPNYSFAVHTRSDRTVRFPPAPWIIIEGLFVLYWPELRDLLQTRVFIDAPDEVCLHRRIQRDTQHRSRRESDVLRQFRDQVRPAAERYIRPTKQYAGIVLDGEQPWEASGALVLASLPR